jgi:hypothetical protein
MLCTAADCKDHRWQEDLSVALLQSYLLQHYSIALLLLHAAQPEVHLGLVQPQPLLPQLLLLLLSPLLPLLLLPLLLSLTGRCA